MTGVNLIPAGRRYAKAHRRRVGFWSASVIGWLGLLLSVAVGMRLTIGRTTGAAAAELESSQQQVTHLNESIADLRKRVAQTELNRQAALTLSDQPDWSSLLQVLSDTAGESIVLRGVTLQGSHDTPEPQQFSLTLHGAARSQPGVSQFVLRLQQAGVFDDVKLLRSGREQSAGGTVISFDIAATLQPESAGRP